MIRTTLAQANYFVLQKNFLAEEKAPNINELPRTLVGLPCGRPTWPFLAARARLSNFAAGQLLTELYQKRTLIKHTLMRNTDYIVDAAQFVAWHTATNRHRTQAFNAEFRLWGIDRNEEVEELGRAILDVIGVEPVTVETITARLPAKLVKDLRQTSRGGRVTTTSNVELAVRWLWAQAVLGAINISPDWRVEALRYGRFNELYPELDLASAPSEAEAQKRLVQAYLAAFGPATEADVSFWTGFGKSETARATAALSSETILTMVEGIPGMLLMLKDQADRLQAADVPQAAIVSVLPADDPFTTAQRASRTRYSRDPKIQRQIFGGTNTAKPAILVNGQIVGGWNWHAENEPNKIEWHLLTDVDNETVAQIEAKLGSVGAFIHPQSMIQRTEE